MSVLRRTRAVTVLALIFVWDLITASVHVALIVLSPRVRTKPAIVAIPVSLHRHWAVALFAYFTSVTPGSTCLHVSPDRKRLYVHLLNSDDAEASAARFDRLYQRWIAELEG